MDIHLRNVTQKELVTFAVFACDQERFVGEAVEAAFAQTYSPLQIILSDDCSTDRTFEIFREMAEAYRGPHQIILNRNAFRRGIGGHFNKVVEMAGGELIVVQAADDISLPSRAQVAYDAWRESGFRATSIHSDFIQIDENGNQIKPVSRNEEQYPKGCIAQQPVEPWIYARNLKPILFGCTHAFSKFLYGTFGEIPDSVTHEDDVLGFRSVLLGGLFYVNEPLVKYRLHGANAYLSSGKVTRRLKDLEQRENCLRQQLRKRETMYESFLRDLETARQKDLIEQAAYDKTVQEAERSRRRYLLMVQFLDGGFIQKIQILFHMRKVGLSKADRTVLIKRLMPRSVFLRILSIRRALRSWAA